MSPLLTQAIMAQVFTDQDFEEEVLKAEGLVLVDFYADWCGPCQMIAPIIEELAETHKDVKIGKVDVDASQGTAQKYGIMSIPAILFFKGGEVVEQITGMRPKEDLEAKINELK